MNLRYRMEPFPTDREEKRRVLMEAAAAVRPVLEAGAQQSEDDTTLAQASVQALNSSGLLRLKLPHVLGGAEADPVTQLEVLEEVSRIDPSAGWCLMIGAASLGGTLGAFLPDEAIEEIFGNGEPPLTAGVFAPSGSATPVDGGYLVTAGGPLAAAYATRNGFPRAPGWSLKARAIPSRCESQCGLPR